MKKGKSFDLVEIVGNTPKYSSELVFGQQCVAAPVDYSLKLQRTHFVKFGYGHHPHPLTFHIQDLKKIGKLTITKIKYQ